MPTCTHTPPPPLRSKGKYVDVVFEVKSNASKDCFPLSFSVVSDPNRITRHLLEVVYSHLYHTRGALAAPGGSGGMSSTSPSGAGHGGGGGGGLGLGGEGSREADLAGDQAAVLNIYKEAPEDEDGITLQEVITKGKQRGISEATVRAATMALQMEGHIYSTVDESHFRCVPRARSRGRGGLCHALPHFNPLSHAHYPTHHMLCRAT